MPFVSLNPATGRVLRRHRSHTAKQVVAALASAHAAFLAWRELPLASRALHLRAVAAELRAQKESLAALVTAEVGKTLHLSRLEVEKCAACCEFYATHAARLLRPRRPAGAPRQARVVHAPLGVVLAAMPWNYPLWQLFRAAAPTLMLGNTVLHKPAASTAGSALAVERVLAAAGAPADILRTLLVEPTALPRLVSDPRVCGVAFTGGTAAGRKIGALAGAALKPCVLELGGSDPYIVLADADLDHAAEVCARARLLNAGQSCIGAKRFVVVESVRAAFEKKFVARMAARRQGPPTDADTDFGPLARTDLRERLHAQIVRSVRRGARLLLGGVMPRGRGFYYPATVLTDVRPGMPAHDEELFGPVAAIISARDEDEAVAIANDTPYGLGAAIFTKRRAHGLRIATERIEAGMVFVNDYVRSDLTLPFGGVKNSGHGRELGEQGLLALANTKIIWAAQKNRPKPQAKRAT